MCYETKSDIKKRLRQNELNLKKLDDRFYLMSCPDGYPGGTSYNDYDTIKGSKKEADLLEYYKQRERLVAMIELDKQKLEDENYIEYPESEEYYKTLSSNEEKVLFLRVVRGFTQEETAEILQINSRTVQRIEHKLKKDGKMPCIKSKRK